MAYCRRAGFGSPQCIVMPAVDYPSQAAASIRSLTTWTLCSVRDVIAALTEIGRVLKRDGSYLFLEHGRSDDPRIARRQNLLSPVVKMIGAGCRMNRRIDDLIRQSGLQITALDRFVMPETPRILGEMYRGVATVGFGDA